VIPTGDEVAAVVALSLVMASDDAITASEMNSSFTRDVSLDKVDHNGIFQPSWGWRVVTVHK
jgi:hypothetical protein